MVTTYETFNENPYLFFTIYEMLNENPYFFHLFDGFNENPYYKLCFFPCSHVFKDRIGSTGTGRGPDQTDADETGPCRDRQRC